MKKLKQLKPAFHADIPAYCDLREYENAIKCCKWAHKTFGEFSPNLASVWARIIKESGLI